MIAIEPALTPYVPRLVLDWLTTEPDRPHRTVDGTLLFADISGFTQLTERLSRKGRVGAEEMSDALDATFGELLDLADRDGADLLKWGGDAVLLLFTESDHAPRAARAAMRMRARLRTVGRLDTTAGRAVLRISQGIQSGPVELFLVGDPALHRELVVCGPAVTAVLRAESAANAGQVLVGGTTAALLPERILGAMTDDALRLLRREPVLDDRRGVASRHPQAAEVTEVLPVAIRQHLLHGAAAPEHREIAVAFVAFSGTDQLLAQCGPAAVADALDGCIRNVAQACADHGVTFFESDVAPDGGKIMLTAGAPTSSGHDAERLLLAVRRIVDRAATLPLRAGVNDGFVFSGDFGPSFRRTYSVKGDAINLAARLTARAAPGEVLATTSVTGHSQTRFVTEALPAFSVKGKARPVTAVALGSRAARQTTVSGTTLVGRDREMTALDEALAGVRDRRGSAVQIVGEAGIGKSRLLAELVARASDLSVLSVVCDEYESSTPYHSMRVLLQDLLGIRARTPRDEAIRRLEDRVRHNAPGLLPWLPLLGTVVDLPVPENDATAGLGEEFRRRRLEESVGELLHVLLPTPSLVVLDDAHHLDSASEGVLAQLVRRVEGEQWLVVIARRSDELAWSVTPTMPVTTLQPKALTLAQSERLLNAATHAHPLPRPAVVALAERAAGNPLFLESLAQTAGPAGGVADLPHSVHDLVTAQVDRLPPADRVVLRYASVLGGRFDSDELAALVRGRAPEPDGSTYRRLGEFLLDAEDGSIRFRHALMREVAYQGLPFRTRRSLHEQVGEALERRDPDGSPELLSLHFFHAGRYDKAWWYSTRAARRARAKFANQEAVDLFSRALEAERRGPPGMVTAAELGSLLEELGDTWFTIGLPDQAAGAYRQACRAFAADPVEAARVVAKQARVDQRLRRLPQSLRRVTRALHQLEQVPGRWASSARSLLCMRYAISRFTQGRLEEALRWGDQAARDAEESTDKATLAQAYATLHGIYVAAGLESPMPYGELALQAYTELDDLPHQADCVNNLAVAALDHNRWVEAAERFGTAAATYRRIGDTQGEGLATYNRAEVLVRQGHLEPAAELLEDALRTGRSVSDQEMVALVRREQGRIACRAGDTAAGLAALDEARDLFTAINEPEELPATDLAICAGLLLAGDDRGCLDATDRMLRAGREEVDDAVLPGLRHLRGHALLHLGDEAGASAAFEAGTVEALATDDRYGRALNLLGLVLVAPDSAEARAQRAEAWAELDSLGVVELPVPG